MAPRIRPVFRAFTRFSSWLFECPTGVFRCSHSGESEWVIPKRFHVDEGPWVGFQMLDGTRHGFCRFGQGFT